MAQHVLNINLVFSGLIFPRVSGKSRAPNYLISSKIHQQSLKNRNFIACTLTITFSGIAMSYSATHQQITPSFYMTELQQQIHL